MSEISNNHTSSSTTDSDNRSSSGCGTNARPDARGRRKKQYARGDSATLVRLIEREADLRRMTIKEAAKQIGTTYSYLHQLRGGNRELRASSSDIVAKCATFPRTSRIAVKLMAGIVEPSDWLPAQLSEAEALYGGFLRMTEHPDGRALVGVDFRALPIEVQRWMVQLFGVHTGVDLLGQASGSGFLDVMERQAVNAEAELRKSLHQQKHPAKSGRRRASPQAMGIE